MTDRSNAISANSIDSPLSLHHISKRFGNVDALNDVSFSAARGAITVLLGENGAGKTTLMRIAFGLVQPDSGWITIDGARAVFESPSSAITAGIGMVHQQFSLVPAMTVAENIALGGKGRYSFDAVARVLQKIEERTGLVLDPSVRVHELSNGERQRLEIVRALAHNARVLILDEPTAVLTPRDTSDLFTELKAFAAAGSSVVLITHKLTDALEHADHVTVLREGRVVLKSDIGDTSHTSLAAAMLGAPVTTASPPNPVSPRVKPPLAILKNALIAVSLHHDSHSEFSIEIMPGEIVGIAALDGAASCLLRVLAGRIPALGGEVTLPGRIAFVPENRSDEALVSDFTLTENVALLDAGKRTGFIDWESLEERTFSVINRYHVKPANPRARPSHLSGGNQQRFVLGRELQNNPPLVVLENPTQGLDISATAFVHNEIMRVTAADAAVVFYSTDLDELAELSHRVLIVSRNGIAAVRPDRKAIGLALLHETSSG